MARTKEFTVQQILSALQASGGFMSIAADKLRCAPNTVKNYIEDYYPDELKPALAEIKHQKLDLAEDKLMEAIGHGNVAAIKFYLERQGRDRGYGIKAELSGPDGGPIDVEFNLILEGPPTALPAPPAPATEGEDG
jgi:hypothetical protein